MRRSVKPFHSVIAELWRRGMSKQQIADAIGPVDGAPFQPGAIRFALNQMRAKGNPQVREGDLMNGRWRARVKPEIQPVRIAGQPSENKNA